MSEGAAAAAADATTADGQPSVPATLEERSQGRRVIVILKRVRERRVWAAWVDRCFALSCFGIVFAAAFRGLPAAISACTEYTSCAEYKRCVVL